MQCKRRDCELASPELPAGREVIRQKLLDPPVRAFDAKKDLLKRFASFMPLIIEIKIHDLMVSEPDRLGADLAIRLVRKQL